MGWGIQVGGRGGVCKVQVLGGAYNTRKMSRVCVTEEEEARGVVLACKLFAESDLRVKCSARWWQRCRHWWESVAGRVERRRVAASGMLKRVGTW